MAFRGSDVHMAVNGNNFVLLKTREKGPSVDEIAFD